MGKIALIYGTFSGLIVISAMLLGFAVSDSGGFFSSQWFGYLIMLVALSLIFVGIKRYRDTELGGVISFWRGLALGLSIAAIAGLAYVIVWEIYLVQTNYAFIEQYIASVLDNARASGVTGAALEAKVAEMDALREGYANPLFRVPMTFLEIFPVGLLVALVSAAILRNSKVLPVQRGSEA